jgi:predicted esterase YcpF (UPF0227 family)
MENYFIERKQDSDTLIIAFTGNAEGMMMDSFEFFAVTNTLNCNRILIKDPSKRVYLKGVGGKLNSMERLIRQLKSDIESIHPKTVTVIGTSGGGFAAILFGHLLKADFVHAFSPTTQVAAGLLNWKKLRKNYKKIIVYVIRLIALSVFQPKLRRYLDLKKVLSHYNGVTHYNIYVCKGQEKDVEAANHLNDCKNLSILKQPCDVHNVVRCMIKNKKLFNIFSGGTPDIVTS